MAEEFMTDEELMEAVLALNAAEREALNEVLDHITRVLNQAGGNVRVLAVETLYREIQTNP